MSGHPTIGAATLLLALALLPAPAAAQEQDALSPAEVAKLFDAYAVVQAQQMLGLDETQYGRFVPRYRALVAARRRLLVERARTVQELNRITRPELASVDEARVQQLLDALDDADLRGAGEVRKATAAVDDVLTLRQRARFRVFEEQMERRKVELLTRARQNARPAPRRRH
jgi:hypothetical protein